MINIFLNFLFWSQIVFPVGIVVALFLYRAHIASAPYLMVIAGLAIVGYFALVLMSASWIGSAAHCERFDEGSTSGCILFGTDISEQLSNVSLTGWFGMFIVPTGLIIALIGGVLLLGGGTFSLLGVVKLVALLFGSSIVIGFMIGLFKG